MCGTWQGNVPAGASAANQDVREISIPPKDAQGRGVSLWSRSFWFFGWGTFSDRSIPLSRSPRALSTADILDSPLAGNYIS